MFFTIPGDLVNVVTINREIKVWVGPLRGRYSTSFEAENDFVLNSHISAGLRKELKGKMRFKTASTHKETTYRVQIQSLLKDLEICQSLPWSSKKYGKYGDSRGACKHCQWATFLKRKRWRVFKRIHK